MLKLERIVAGYGRTTVLRDVDIEVAAGSVVALLGRNGAGKTTLLRVASGALRSASGSVEVDGESRTNAGAFRIAKAGVCHIPEGRSIFRGLTVRENLLLFTPPTMSPDAAIGQVAEAFGWIPSRLGQLAGTLSGGQQQMLALSRGYLAEAKYVLLDEVSMGLAPVVIDEIFEFLGTLAGRGKALLLVEQYVQRALGLASHVYLLDRGRISFSGPPTELDEGELIERYVGGGAANAG